ncbi:hypothetical protein [Terriglobus albidus]|uniref:hypothetical protein n=1 Tax=Terriglobus albidus TaxID=1592106 RepID=UPI0021DF4473|nr:hypothetical protein [Terriglobus albidus]
MESPAQFSTRIRRLEHQACFAPEDEALYHALMAEAKDRGLNYKEALEYTIRICNGGAD